MKDGEEDSVASPSTGEKGGTGKEGEDQEVKRRRRNLFPGEQEGQGTVAEKGKHAMSESESEDEDEECQKELEKERIESEAIDGEVRKILEDESVEGKDDDGINEGGSGDKQVIKILKNQMRRVMTLNQRLVRRLDSRENSVRKINSRCIINSLKIFFGDDPSVNRQLQLETGKGVEEVKRGMVDVAAKAGQILSLAQSVESNLHSMRTTAGKPHNQQQIGAYR